MPILDSTVAALRQENADLRNRLDVSEEILRAIRSGEVDAITVETPSGLGVFTLKGADQPYRVMVETMSEGAATVTPGGNITYCNQCFADMIKADLGTIIGSRLLMHFADDDKEKLARPLGKHQTETPRVQATLLASDGTRVPVNVAINSQTDGETHDVAIVVNDLTEIVIAQKALAKLNRELEQVVATRTADLERAIGELTAANRELQTFAYSVSHDLRAPLRAIDGFSYVLLEDYSDKLDAEGKRLLHVLRDGATRMGHLINDILEFSRIGRLELATFDSDMGSLVQNTLRELAPAMADRKIEIRVGPLPHVQGDPQMLQRVWTNLLDNAIKYTGSTPNAAIEIGARAEGAETAFFVKDNGAGFDNQYVDKLFGVFQRLHSREQFPGTGIGLAIVKRIVARHGGRVWAEGKVGQGATFCFALPGVGSRSAPIGT